MDSASTVTLFKKAIKNNKKTATALDRWDKCPMGKDLQPGCKICRKCEHYLATKAYVLGAVSCVYTECLATQNEKVQSQ
jgi:hypothetical protein